jgi:peptidyl-prolyl cis-trans isomerase D
MATLQRIRNHSVALLVIVGLAMAAFIVGDLLTSSSSILQSSRDKVVTINGKKITYEEYETARNNMAELQKSLFGRSDLNNEAAQQLNNQVYQNFITGALMDEAGKQLGITVTDAEFNELTQGDYTSPVLRQIFTNPSTGQYMKDAVDFWVNLVVNNNFEEVAEQYRQAGSQMPEWATLNNWLVIEDQIKLTRKLEKYNSILAAAVAPNKLEAKEQFEGNNTECTFAYVKQGIQTVGDSLVKVSSADVNKRYNATRYNFKQGATRDINYIAVALRPSAADYAAKLEEMQSLRDEFTTSDDLEDLINANSSVPFVDAYVALTDLDTDIRDFVEGGQTGDILEPTRKGTSYTMARILGKKTAPDSLKLSIIVVSNQAKADSLNAVVNGGNFSEVAKDNCEDPKLAAVGGEFGWMTEAATVASFGKENAEKILSTGVGKTFRMEIHNGVASTLYVIGKVDEATAPIAKAKVAVFALDVTPTTATRREEYGKLNNFLVANKTVKAMQDSAMSAGYVMRQTSLSTDAYNVDRIADARQAVRFAFQNEVGKVSEIYECGDNLLVVAVTGAAEDGYLTPKDSMIYKGLEYQLLGEAKSAKLAADMEKVADKSLEGYAAAFDCSVDTAKHVNFNLSGRIFGLGVEPEVVAAALSAQPGTVVGPIAGKSNAVVLKVLEKSQKEGADKFDEEAAKQAVASGRDYYALRNALGILVKYADIQDNRISFY